MTDDLGPSAAASANRQLVLHYFDTMMGLRDDRPIGDFFAADATWEVPRSNPSIVPNPRIGHAAVMDILTTGVSVYQPGSMRMQLRRVVADDRHVVAQFGLTARLAGGGDYANEYLFLFSVRDNQIDGVWEYLDTLHQARQGTFEPWPA